MRPNDAIAWMREREARAHREGERVVIDWVPVGVKIPPGLIAALAAYPGDLAALGSPTSDAPAARIARQEGGRGPSQSALLLALVADADLFHDAAGETYATIAVGNHYETHVTKSKGFRLWLARTYYTEHGGVPGGQAVADALHTIAGQARFAGAERPVYVRLAEHDGHIYVDLCDPQWRVVEISATGWRVIPAADCPVRFRRTRGMLPLPEPTRDGAISDLRRFVNVATDADFVLVVAWLVAALRPRGPYPVLNQHGEQGSGKTNTARVLRDLVDPHEAPVRTLPRDERDLMISATNNWLPVFDNVSGIPVWLSDALCRIATGGGFATRELYSDSDEVILNAMRPVILTGIEDVANRSDLLDRSIIVTLPRIPDDRRQTESAFRLAFELARPALFGALCTAVAGALATVDAVRLPRLPRMADFAVWATAAEAACGFTPGTFMTAYAGAREEANRTAIEAAAIGPTVLAFVQQVGQWSGTASELLRELNRHADDRTRAAKGWPPDGTRLSGQLRRLAPNLRAVGVTLDLGQRTGHNRTRALTLGWEGKSASAASAASANGWEASDGGENGADAARANADAADADHMRASARGGSGGGDADAADAADADLRPYPGARAIVREWAAGVRNGWNDPITENVQRAANHCGLGHLDPFNVEQEARRVLAFLDACDGRQAAD